MFTLKIKKRGRRFTQRGGARGAMKARGPRPKKPKPPRAAVKGTKRAKPSRQKKAATAKAQRAKGAKPAGLKKKATKIQQTEKPKKPAAQRPAAQQPAAQRPAAQQPAAPSKKAVDGQRKKLEDAYDSENKGEIPVKKNNESDTDFQERKKAYENTRKENVDYKIQKQNLEDAYDNDHNGPAAVKKQGETDAAFKKRQAGYIQKPVQKQGESDADFKKRQEAYEAKRKADIERDNPEFKKQGDALNRQNFLRKLTTPGKKLAATLLAIGGAFGNMIAALLKVLGPLLANLVKNLFDMLMKLAALAAQLAAALFGALASALSKLFDGFGNLGLDGAEELNDKTCTQKCELITYIDTSNEKEKRDLWNKMISNNFGMINNKTYTRDEVAKICAIMGKEINPCNMEVIKNYQIASNKFNSTRFYVFLCMWLTMDYKCNKGDCKEAENRV
jgi:hypothetical protein